MTHPADPNTASALASLQAMVKVPPSLTLSAEEQRQLSGLLSPGGLLNKILKSAVDHADHMKDHIATATLVAGHPELEAARQLQLKRQATLEFLSWIASLILPANVQSQQKDKTFQ